MTICDYKNDEVYEVDSQIEKDQELKNECEKASRDEFIKRSIENDTVEIPQELHTCKECGEENETVKKRSSYGDFICDECNESYWNEIYGMEYGRE